MKHVVILGAGISGLSLGWFLRQRHGDHLKITIIEKEARAGGWIETKKVGHFLFEQGPRELSNEGGMEEKL